VVFGDSAASTISIRLVCPPSLGQRSSTSPTRGTALVVGGDETLRRYLRNNRPPRLIVFYFVPWDLNLDDPATADSMMARACSSTTEAWQANLYLRMQEPRNCSFSHSALCCRKQTDRFNAADRYVPPNGSVLVTYRIPGGGLSQRLCSPSSTGRVREYSGAPPRHRPCAKRLPTDDCERRMTTRGDRARPVHARLRGRRFPSGAWTGNIGTGYDDELHRSYHILPAMPRPDLAECVGADQETQRPDSERVQFLYCHD